MSQGSEFKIKCNQYTLLNTPVDTADTIAPQTQYTQRERDTERETETETETELYSSNKNRYVV